MADNLSAEGKAKGTDHVARSRNRIVTLFTAIVLAGAGNSAMAADAETGRQIFEQWCTSCHASKTADKAGDAAPPLSAIVNAPTLSEGNMKVWLANPHPPMPNLSLGKIEIDNLVAYFKSLRKE